MVLSVLQHGQLPGEPYSAFDCFNYMSVSMSRLSLILREIVRLRKWQVMMKNSCNDILSRQMEEKAALVGRENPGASIEYFKLAQKLARVSPDDHYQRLQLCYMYVLLAHTKIAKNYAKVKLILDKGIIDAVVAPDPYPQTEEKVDIVEAKQEDSDIVDYDKFDSIPDQPVDLARQNCGLPSTTSEERKIAFTNAVRLVRKYWDLPFWELKVKNKVKVRKVCVCSKTVAGGPVLPASCLVSRKSGNLDDLGINKFKQRYKLVGQACRQGCNIYESIYKDPGDKDSPMETVVRIAKRNGILLGHLQQDLREHVVDVIRRFDMARRGVLFYNFGSPSY